VAAVLGVGLPPTPAGRKGESKVTLPGELSSSELRRKCDFGSLEFQTTDDLESLEGLLGQARAVEAIEFGIGIEREGYNIFSFGPEGTGKHSAVRQMLRRRTESTEAPDDLCYVYNFDEPHRPRLLALPAGKGRVLREAMEHLIEEVASALQSALESEAYQTRRQMLEEEFDDEQTTSLVQLTNEASEAGLAMMQTPMGILFAPQRGDDVMSAEDLESLPEAEQEKVKKEVERFKKKLQKLFRQVPRRRREKRERIRELNREVSRFAVGPAIDEVREAFVELEPVLEYLKAVEDDIVENAPRLSAQRESGPLAFLQNVTDQETPEMLYRRYRVNLLVDHAEQDGAPIVYEDNPTYQNLVGRVEHVPQLGTLVTDFTLIKPGALHRANGGYLLLDALKLLQHPYAWDGLKRVLRAGEVRIEALVEALSLASTYSLQPEPMPLSIKIVLFGNPRLYYLLSHLDPDFRELFKVAADFGERIDWSPENVALYARLIAKLAREKNLKPFDRAAVARVIERGSRSVGDARKLSLFMGRILDLMREADHWASRAKREVVNADDVQQAIDAREFRSDRIRERIQEAIGRNLVLVATEGEAIGQVNGLSVQQLDDFSFGRPARITARIRLGKGEVIDIEREVELSGPLHSKGVLILSGFLGGRYAGQRPLSLSASLVFEQSYGGVDGDSASSAELYALISAISRTPLRQSLAVTGSVNQQGEVQVIGGVNEKIEGFFDVCAARGLSGEQGVLIPAANVEHLMLRQDVVDAVEAGQFHIHPVRTIDEGIAILTGVPAGERDGEGSYPEGSVNARVEERLVALARLAREHESPSGRRARADKETDESWHEGDQ
jgi:lon-related putative ATP-dependent protease